MKGLSVVVTILLFVIAVALSDRLKKARIISHPGTPSASSETFSAKKTPQDWVRIVPFVSDSY